MKGLFYRRKKIIFWVWLLTFFTSLFFLSLTLLAPLSRSRHLSWSSAIYATFAPFCHQLPGRSFWLWGAPLALCGRCFGILTGFFLGVALFPTLNRRFPHTLPPLSLFLFLSGPIALDTLGNTLHLWSTPNWPRFFIGLTWGVILPFYFIPGIADLWIKLGRSAGDLQKESNSA